MAIVGAKISVGLFIRIATSSPKTVLPEPDGATICKWSSSGQKALVKHALGMISSYI